MKTSYKYNKLVGNLFIDIGGKTCNFSCILQFDF